MSNFKKNEGAYTYLMNKSGLNTKFSVEERRENAQSNQKKYGGCLRSMMRKTIYNESIFIERIKIPANNFIEL